MEKKDYVKKMFLLLIILLSEGSFFAQSKKVNNCGITVSCGGYTGEFEIKKSEALALQGLTVTDNCDKSVSYEVISFDFTSVGKKTVNLKGNNTSKFSKQMIDAIIDTPPGKKIYIDNIKIKYSDGNNKRVNGLTLKIK